MTEKPSGMWKWCLLVVALAIVHLVVVTYVDLWFTHPRFGPRAINAPPYQPLWPYFVFINVLAFPAAAVFQWYRGSPDYNAVRVPLVVLTCLLWGCIWAEPFRRKYGWKPWRFTTRDLFIMTTIVAALLGLFAWFH